MLTVPMGLGESTGGEFSLHGGALGTGLVVLGRVLSTHTGSRAWLVLA